MDQEIRFCSSADGVRIAYAKVGMGPPIVRVGTFLTHLEYDWRSPVWRPWLDNFSRFNTLYRYDARGCGLSDREVDDFSLEALMGDLEAVVAQVPACGDEPPPDDPDGILFEAIRSTLLGGDVSGTPETTVGPLPVVSFDQLGTPSQLTPLTAFCWFIEYGGRYGTNWENWATYVVPETPVPFLPVLCTPHIKAPLLLVIAKEDEMPGANSAIARMAFDLALQPKELVEIDGGHFGLIHYPGQLFDQSSNKQRDFLQKYL